MASIELALTSALGLSVVGTGVEDVNAMPSRIEAEAGICAFCSSGRNRSEQALVPLTATLTVWSVWYVAPALHMKPSSSLFLT